jgi:CBS domain-containing protein
MGELDVGMLPVCNEDRRLDGAITDRDIAIKVVGEGRDPSSTTVDDVCERVEVVTVGADDSIEVALETMKRHAVRRLPVIDGNEVVGMLSQADVSRRVADAKTGDLVQSISEAPPD